MAATVLASDTALKGMYAGWFAPDYKKSSEAFNDIIHTIGDALRSSSRIDGIIRTMTGGRIDFWTLENESAGRSRRYHRIIMDEVAFTKANMTSIWERSIEPTLLDYGGECWAFSNTNGNADDNFFYQICHESKFRFHEYHAPTYDNPLIPIRKKDETEEQWQHRREQVFAELKAERHPLVYQQEYLAEFVDWSGSAFFDRTKLLDLNEIPPECPIPVDSVFAVMDTAIKTGKDNDGTAIIYFAYRRAKPPYLYVLDWDITQIEGASLEAWLPSCFKRLEELARTYKAVLGSLGIHIEDAQSGTILLQQSQRRGWPAFPINIDLTKKGKDERAISISGYVHQALIRITKYAWEKVCVYKGTSRNHFTSQLFGFRVGDKDASKRADDLFDCFCYGVAIALGDNSGH